MINNEQRKARLARWHGYQSATYRRWRVYSTFLTGLLIGLLYVIIISEWKVPSQVFGGLLDQRTLILMFSGIMGGVIYTILVDGHVEMPRFVASKGDQFEAGLFGDILLGIAGAIVLDFITQQTALRAIENIQVAALGIIGGYGGRAILQFALNRMFSDINVLEEDRRKYLKVAYQQKMEAMDGLKIIDQLNNHIQTGLINSELAELTAAIRQAPIDIRKQVFVLAKDFHRTANLSDVTKPRIARTTPIFEALIDSEPDNHQFYAEAAFAYKDSGLPDLFKAIQYLDKAIETRGNRHQAETWKYELSRAITRIQQVYENTRSYEFEPQINELIIADLLTVANVYNLQNILKSAREKQIPIPVWEWAEQNRATLLSRKDTADLAIQFLDVFETDSTVEPLMEEISDDSQPGLALELPPPKPEVKADPKMSKLEEKIVTVNTVETKNDNRKIDRDIFFKHYRSNFNLKNISQEQVDTFDAIFDYWDKISHTDLRWLAYSLATAYHETGGRMTPVREGFAKSDEDSIQAVRQLLAKGYIKTDYSKLHANGKSYFGRGLVQITHGDNYKKLGKALGLGNKLYDDPNMALNKNIAVKLLFVGMIDGLYRSEHKLSVYFNSIKEDWLGAREIINGDKNTKPKWAEGKSIGQLVADHGKKFYQCCRLAKLDPSNSSSSPTNQRKFQDKQWMEAVEDTWLKKSPVQADLLPPEQKKRCETGTRYGVEIYEKAENGHFFVKLAYGAGEWHIFDSTTENHWDTTWENDHDESGESISASAEDKLEQTRLESAEKQPVGDKLTKEMPFDTLITPHITYGELTKYQEARRFTQNYQCKTAYELCLFLEKCREHFGGKPVIITSGHRPEPINTQQKGAKDSEHLYDHPKKGAIDFCIKDVNVYDLQNWCLKNYSGSVGKGAHKGFVHIGIRPGPRPKPWNY